MIDVTQQISATRRTIGTRVLEAGEARVLTITRTYATPLDDLWDACTNAERIPRWFLPISGDLRPGGRYELTGNASGTIERCDPPRSFSATWEYGSEVSWIELRLTAEGEDSTRFELEHVAHVDDERWAQYGPGAVGIGWDLGLIGLALHLASGGEPVDRDAVMAWMASDDGRAFVAGSSRAWRDASVAAGTDAALADAAEAGSTAFYTGE